MDVVVTVPLSFGLDDWIEEGDAAGDPWSGQEWAFTTGGLAVPRIEPGERVYVVNAKRLRGYAPLIRVERWQDNSQLGSVAGSWRLAFVRGGGAVAVTIPEEIQGFRGWRYRWWKREDEQPFPEWKVA